MQLKRRQTPRCKMQGRSVGLCQLPKVNVHGRGFGEKQRWGTDRKGCKRGWLHVSWCWSLAWLSSAPDHCSLSHPLLNPLLTLHNSSLYPMCTDIASAASTKYQLLGHSVMDLVTVTGVRQGDLVSQACGVSYESEWDSRGAGKALGHQPLG